MHWMIELCRIDILTEFSLLFSHLTLPHECHLDAALLHVMGYSTPHHNSCLVLDPPNPTNNRETFQNDHDWTKFYSSPCEPIPPDNFLKGRFDTRKRSRTQANSRKRTSLTLSSHSSTAVTLGRPTSSNGSLRPSPRNAWRFYSTRRGHFTSLPKRNRRHTHSNPHNGHGFHPLQRPPSRRGRQIPQTSLWTSLHVWGFHTQNSMLCPQTNRSSWHCLDSQRPYMQRLPWRTWY
jgi:hypothetical protein